MPSSSSASPPREASGSNGSPSDEWGEWSKEENKAFENSLATYGEEFPDRWERISERLPGKTPEQIKRHYDSLVEDLDCIDAGRVPIPQYVDEGEESDEEYSGFRGLKKSKNGAREQERRKGVPWTEDEHRLFLMGLNTYGKGDWRSISRNFVISRTPTQVASHAQKYFNRLNSSRTKERRRPSIHDIRSVRSSEVVATSSVNPFPHGSPFSNFASNYVSPSLHPSAQSPVTAMARYEEMGISYSINDLMGAPSRAGYPAPPPATFAGGFGAFGSGTASYGSYAQNSTMGMH